MAVARRLAFDTTVVVWCRGGVEGDDFALKVDQQQRCDGGLEPR
jgi:hypothetical protein